MPLECGEETGGVGVGVVTGPGGGVEVAEIGAWTVNCWLVAALTPRSSVVVSVTVWGPAEVKVYGVLATLPVSRIVPSKSHV